MGQFHNLLSNHIWKWAAIDEYAAELVNSTVTFNERKTGMKVRWARVSWEFMDANFTVNPNYPSCKGKLQLVVSILVPTKSGNGIWRTVSCTEEPLLRTPAEKFCGPINSFTDPLAGWWIHVKDDAATFVFEDLTSMNVAHQCIKCAQLGQTSAIFFAILSTASSTTATLSVFLVMLVSVIQSVIFLQFIAVLFSFFKSGSGKGTVLRSTF